MCVCDTKNAPPKQIQILVCNTVYKLIFAILPKYGRHKRIIVTRLFSRRTLVVDVDVDDDEMW